MPLVRGATAAGLQIVRLLGSGQIGELYLAEHPRLPRHLALKVVSDDLSADPEYRHRFKRESELAAALWHPHIVGIYDRGEFEGRLWLSMDYVDGVDAAHLLSDTYPNGMPPDLVVEIVAAIADALDYAHDQGLLHRYVNPSNILLANSASDRRRILLAGFGIARRPDDVNSLTRTNMAIGTASYTAPEHLKEEELDGRADQYALACTAFHLLTGSPPFAHMNPAVVISKHLNESPPRPGDGRPELTRFDGIFARALATEPSDRFRRCRDFARALERGDSKRFNVVDAGAAAVPTASESNGAAPTQPAKSAAPDAEVDDVIAPPDVPPDAAARDASTPPERFASSTTSDDAPMTSRRRRLLHTATLVLPIAVVAIAGFVIVIYLRSASESQDTPTNVEPTSSVAPIAPAPRPPARATPPPVMTAPPPPTIKPTASTPPSPTTTTAVTSPPSSPKTTAPPTTKATTTKVPTPTSSTPPAAGVDSRPAIGMPCGPNQTGATTVGNTGGPVSCVQTPGGFAWEPPGG